VDQPPATTPAAAPAQPQDDSRPLQDAAPPTQPGFGSRGRLRRRARFLRKARELAYRDLGGLVFSLHRFGQRNDELVLAKLSTLSRIDAELRALESSLAERQPVTVLREAGITACPRCAAIHSGEDRFCPSCGLPLSRNVDLPIGAAPVAAPPAGLPEAAPATAAMQAAPVAGSSAATPGATPTAPATTAGTPVPDAAQTSPAGAPVPATAQTPPAGAPAAPTPARAQPTPAGGAAPSPAGQPATQTHATVGPAGNGGRSPAPSAPSSAKQEEDDQPTEIIRPPAAGS
jgi:hypothetical protein